MLDWKDIVQDYIIKYANQISKATRPLRDHFGISYFTYHKIDADGKYVVLVDRPDWAENYVTEQLFRNDPYLRHPAVYQSGISLIGSYGSKEYKKNILEAGKKVLGVDIGAILIQKNDSLVEFFGFFGSKKDSFLESLYLNHSPLLKSFAIHFKKELRSILTDMEKSSSLLVDLKGKDFFCEENIDPNIALPTRLAYYKDLGMKSEIEKIGQLSSRERQCVKLLVQDKSAKETAIILGLSPRTVEFYLENVKDKLFCFSKLELAKLVKNFEYLGLL